MMKRGVENQSNIKKVLWVGLGIVLGYVLDIFLTNILIVLTFTGYVPVFDLLLLEGKIVLGVLAILTYILTKNKVIKLLAIGALVYAVIAYIYFKLYVLPESLNRLAEVMEKFNKTLISNN